MACTLQEARGPQGSESITLLFEPKQEKKRKKKQAIFGWSFSRTLFTFSFYNGAFAQRQSSVLYNLDPITYCKDNFLQACSIAQYIVSLNSIVQTRQLVNRLPTIFFFLLGQAQWLHARCVLMLHHTIFLAKD